MKRTSLLTFAATLSLLLGGLVYAQAADSNEQPQMNPAPQAQVQGGAPPEAQLTPPPDSELVEPTEGFAEVDNPAFPGREVEAVVVHRGRRYDLSDIAPYFADGKLLEAKTEFDKGHYAKARELLEGQGDAIHVRYLKALASLRAEDFETAAKEFPSIAEEYVPMRDRCLVHAADALEQLKRFEDAAAFYEGVDQGSKMYAEARLGLARVLRKNKQNAEAMEAVKPLALLPAPGWGRDVGAEALLLTADLAKEKKDSAGELAALLQLWGKHPLSTLAEPAEARIKGIKKGSITPEATIWRAEALIDSHRNKQGMALLAPLLPLLKLPDPLACKAHFLNGKALRKERKHSQAVTSLVPVVTKCTDPDLRARAMYVLGSSQSIVDLDRGAKTYEGLAHEFPTHSFADDALFYAADLYVKLGELDAAMKTLTELAEKYPGGDFAAEALFKRFWIQRERGQTDEAVKTLELLRKSYREAEESYEYERATYWLGRMHEKSDPKAAVALFQEVAVDHPATYYGLIARDRIAALDNDAFNKLGQKLAFPEAGAPVWPLFAGPLGDDPHFRAGVELYRLGLTEAVTSELLAANRTNQPPEAVRLLVQILSLSGDARSAHAVARVSLRRDLSGRISPENRFVWEVAYPRAFRDSIEEHCKSAGFDPDLLQALMREESALDPKALSWAGALGLTQLMPSTAIQVAHSLKLKTPSTAALLEPALNIRLGASYLGTLLKQWKGNKQYALGSYNAGAKAVQKWRDDNPKLELDEWVEEIPIAETRGYVKRVLRSYNTYQLLYPTRPPVKTASNSAERK